MCVLALFFSGGGAMCVSVCVFVCMCVCVPVCLSLSLSTCVELESSALSWSTIPTPQVKQGADFFSMDFETLTALLKQ